MAKILISYFSELGEAMYDAISSVLLENGNDVYRFNINTHGVKFDTWGGNSFLKDKEILEDISKFNPELILNFNHSLPVNVYSCLNTECAVCILDADNPETFWNKDLLSKNKDNYIYLGLQSYSKVMYESFLCVNLKEGGNYLYFPPATIVKNKKLEQDKNITFIGSNFYPLEVPHVDEFYSKESLELYKEIKKDYFYSISNQRLIDNNINLPDWVSEKVRHYYVGQERLKYLQCLTDLGLTLYGVPQWNRVAYYDFDIACCFDPTPQFTIQDNQWVYNTSKISVNISHPQAKSSFSWRVMDIMASNACLLMENKSDWRDLFQKFISKEVLDAIIYQDRYDMREKAIALLENEELRKRCVQELNYAIEKAGRWEHRFLSLEKLIGLSIFNCKNERGDYTYIKRAALKESPKNVSNSVESINPSSEKTVDAFNNHTSLRSRYKIFYHSLVIALSQLPCFNRVINKRIREKSLRSIGKYWY